MDYNISCKGLSYMLLKSYIETGKIINISDMSLDEIIKSANIPVEKFKEAVLKKENINIVINF